MIDKSVLDILDEKPFAELSEPEKALFAREATDAYEAARISSVLLKTSGERAFEPSPFFARKVLANLSERRESLNPFRHFAKIWQAAGGMVAAMIISVLILLVLTVFAPKNEILATTENDSEIVIIDRANGKNLSNEQLFRVIYGSERMKGKGNGQGK